MTFFAAWLVALWAALIFARFWMPLKATIVIAARIAITTMTISNSTMVKPPGVLLTMPRREPERMVEVLWNIGRAIFTLDYEAQAS
jgi:hypothetical protein